jgi:hypothetical protein
MEKLLDALVDEVADRVIKKLSDQNSNWLNTINYKVDIKNITGFNEAVANAIEEGIDMDEVRREARDAAAETAEETIKNANFNVDVSF